MKTAKGIPCNETRHTVKAEKDRIRFRFVTDDGNTPSTCTVGIGDTDPLTGEPITNMTFFKEYYRMEDHDIYSYWKGLRPALTPEEKKQRNEKREKIIAEFEKQYGYRPSESDLHWLTDDFMPDRFAVSIERYRDEEDNPESDRISGLGIPGEDPFSEDETDDVLRLKELAATLDAYMTEIYEWLLVKYAGGKEKLSLKDIADRWGVSRAKAYQDKDEIIRKIRAAIGSTRD